MTTSDNSNRQMSDPMSRIETTALEASTETQTDDTVAEETYELLPSGD